eukprot:5185255-Amphidinium_carterae.1
MNQVAVINSVPFIDVLSGLNQFVGCIRYALRLTASVMDIRLFIRISFRTEGFVELQLYRLESVLHCLMSEASSWEPKPGTFDYLYRQ